MSFEDLEPRPVRGDALKALAREDLDVYAVEELNDRIDALTAEIERCRRSISGKEAKKSAADALFTFR